MCMGDPAQLPHSRRIHLTCFCWTLKRLKIREEEKRLTAARAPLPRRLQRKNRGGGMRNGHAAARLCSSHSVAVTANGDIVTRAF
jgi:hypothetical protein